MPCILLQEDLLHKKLQAVSYFGRMDCFVLFAIGAPLKFRACNWKQSSTIPTLYTISNQHSALITTIGQRWGSIPCNVIALASPLPSLKCKLMNNHAFCPNTKPITVWSKYTAQTPSLTMPNLNQDLHVKNIQT